MQSSPLKRLYALALVASALLMAASGSRIQAAGEAEAAIEKLGGLVLAIARDSDELEVDLHLGARENADEALAHVARLKNVVSLHLGGTRVTDAGLVHLKNLKELRRLHLEKTGVSDAGITNLRGLIKLDYLNLYATGVTDNSIEHLKGLKALSQLYLWQTGVTDEGTKKLQKALPGLEIERGADLSKIAKPVPPVPREDLKWTVAGVSMPPKSVSGNNISILFENKSGKRVRAYWVSYDGELKLYGQIDAGGTRDQNTYAGNTWVITDEKDKHLGDFITNGKDARAVIPKGI